MKGGRREGGRDEGKGKERFTYSIGQCCPVYFWENVEIGQLASRVERKQRTTATLAHTHTHTHTHTCTAEQAHPQLQSLAHLQNGSLVRYSGVMSAAGAHQETT